VTRAGSADAAPADRSPAVARSAATALDVEASAPAAPARAPVGAPGADP
jgi:hypothetical protein